jgi:hypothetical protein
VSRLGSDYPAGSASAQGTPGDAVAAGHCHLEHAVIGLELCHEEAGVGLRIAEELGTATHARARGTANAGIGTGLVPG